MKILADQNISLVADAFADLGEVKLMPGREIRPEHLRDCQCLITRTVTRVDEALLKDSAVEFVGRTANAEMPAIFRATCRKT